MQTHALAKVDAPLLSQVTSLDVSFEALALATRCPKLELLRVVLTNEYDILEDDVDALKRAIERLPPLRGLSLKIRSDFAVLVDQKLVALKL